MADIQNNCSEIIKDIDTNNIVLNSDGTVSVFTNNSTLGLYPVQLTLECCKTLPLKGDIKEYFFDIDIQKCKWSNIPISCGFSEPINLVINPQGDNGALFFIDNSENETCGLKISFDYLIKIKCETLMNILNPTITTNYVTSGITAQINTSQQNIESFNSQIEIKTNAIISLNTQIANTPYSIYCLQYPIVTPDIPVDCVVSDWSAWGPCVNGLETRNKTVITEPEFGGASCPVTTDTRPCTVTPEPPTTPICNQYLGMSTNQIGGYVDIINCSGVAEKVSVVYNPQFPQKQTSWCAISIVNNSNVAVVNPGLCTTTPPPTTNNSCYTFKHTASRDSLIKYTDCSGLVKNLSTSRGGNYTFCAQINTVSGNAGTLIADGLCTTTPTTPTTTPCFTYLVYLPPSLPSNGNVGWTDCNGNKQSGRVDGNVPLYICAKENTIIGSVATIKQISCGNTTAKLANFNNTGFVSKTIDNTLANTSVFKAAGTSHTSVNYCLTLDGLDAWKSILDSTGGTRYNAFINGTKAESEASFTCADVVKLVEAQNDINNTKVLFEECTTPFWTKNNLINQLNILMTELTTLTQQLTDERNKLIDLESQISSGTTNNTTLCATPREALETIELEMHLDYIDDKDNNKSKVAFSAVTFPAINTIKKDENPDESINLYDYLALTGDSGFYICGDPSNTDIGLSACTTLSLNNGIEQTPNVSSCSTLYNKLFQGLTKEYINSLSNNALASNWLTYTTVINDPEIIKLITNKRIKLSVKVNFSCVDFCVLLDNIVLDKSCITSNRNDVIISKNPGFNLKRIVDNKKSWTDITTQTNRNFIIAKSNGDTPFRQTNYDLNDERLIINSKEIDLDITIASAIETDVLFYLNDNYNVLNSTRYCNPCDDATKLFQDTEPVDFMNDFEYVFQDAGENNNYVVCCGDKSVDFTELINIDLSTINNVNDFDAFMLSELIDAKNRQTISGYPTLRAIYDRYINSTKYVNTKSSAFDYITMDNFSKLIGSYWVDIIEQVVPSTSIWGSVKIYTNTIFDEQKFKYKEYTSILCNKNKDCDTLYIGLSETNHIESVNTNDTIIEVIETLVNPNDTTLKLTTKPVYFDNIFLSQMSVGSEFLGKVLVTKK
jgi:hypothetical protein